MLFLLCLLFFLARASIGIHHHHRDCKHRVKVVVIVHFQNLHAISSPASGEAHWWYSRFGLNITVTATPNGFGSVFRNSKGDVLLLLTGPGKSNAATSVMSLGYNQQFDLQDVFWIENGIGGGSPNQTTIGSVVFVQSIVDGEISSAINPRQLPESMPYFQFQLGCTVPPFCSNAYSYGTNIYEVNEILLRRALEDSSSVVLKDNSTINNIRQRYVQRAARGPPEIQNGSLFGGDTFTHGSMYSNQMAWWVRESTGAKAVYVVTANEEPAVATAIARLAAVGRANFSRYLSVRGVSNFDQEYEGQTALQSLQQASEGGVPDGLGLALENVYLVAKTVVNAWLL